MAADLVLMTQYHRSFGVLNHPKNGIDISSMPVLGAAEFLTESPASRLSTKAKKVYRFHPGQYLQE